MQQNNRIRPYNLSDTSVGSIRLIKITFLCLLILSACSQDKRPKGILDQQKMIEVTADLHIIDGYLSTLMYTDSARILGKNFYVTIYEKHHISRADYEESLKYYSMQPVLLDSMYNKVEDILRLKEEELYKIEEKEQRKMMNSK
jgi:hypothetical protein